MLTRARAFSTDALKVINNVAKQQFAVTVGNAVAQIDYQKTGNEITFTNTNVPKECQGKGVGKILAKYAFDHAQNNNCDVVCECTFLAKYYQENINQYKNLKVTMKLEDE